MSRVHKPRRLEAFIDERGLVDWGVVLVLGAAVAWFLVPLAVAALWLGGIGGGAG